MNQIHIFVYMNKYSFKTRMKIIVLVLVFGILYYNNVQSAAVIQKNEDEIQFTRKNCKDVNIDSCTTENIDNNLSNNSPNKITKSKDKTVGKNKYFLIISRTVVLKVSDSALLGALEVYRGAVEGSGENGGR